MQITKKKMLDLSLGKYNAHTDPLFKILKLLKVNDIFKLQELKFYYKYKNNILPHYLHSLLFHPNTRTHDHDTRIKYKIHNPIGKHVFTKTVFGLIYPKL